MPMEAPVLPARIWLAGCIVHRDLPVGAPEVDVKVDGKLLGVQSLWYWSHILAPRMEYKAFLSITCVHGDTQQVPARRVTISATLCAWPVEIGVIKDLPIPVLIRRD